MSTTARSILSILLLILLAIPSGCSSIRSPRFESVGVREVEHTDARTVYSFAVTATNPNKEPIPLKQVTYTVTLNDGSSTPYTFTGVRSPETTLHTYAQHTFELPAVFDITPDQLAGVIDYTIRGSTKYLKPGKLNEVLFDSKISVPKAEFTLRGKVNVDQPTQMTE